MFFWRNVTGQKVSLLLVICLWVSVATLFAHSWLLAVLLFILACYNGLSGDIELFAGANLAGITLADPIWLSPIGGGCVWSMVLPFGLFLAEKMGTIQK